MFYLPLTVSFKASFLRLLSNGIFIRIITCITGVVINFFPLGTYWCKWSEWGHWTFRTKGDYSSVKKTPTFNHLTVVLQVDI